MTARKLGVLVPEFRTSEAPDGGLATVADFILSAVDRHPNWEAVVVSPRMSRRAVESRAITRPRSWWTLPSSQSLKVGGHTVTYIGADMCDIEVARRWRRRALTDALGDVDAVLVVAGTPATFTLARSLGVPVIGQVATTIKAERASFLKSTHGLRRAYQQMTAIVLARRDSTGVRIPDVVVVENREMERWAESNGARLVALITPGVSRDVFQPKVDESPDSRERYLLSVGRFGDPRKDPRLLIEAFVIAVERHHIPHALVLAGSAPPDWVLGPAADRGLLDRVRIHVKPTTERLVELYQQADVFVSSSSEEGLGLVLIEAMSCRVPVVATATEGARQVIGRSAAGRLVDFGPGLKDRLAEAIHQMVVDPSSHQAAAEAAALRSAAFDDKVLGDQFIGLVESACRIKSMDTPGGVGAI